LRINIVFLIGSLLRSVQQLNLGIWKFEKANRPCADMSCSPESKRTRAERRQKSGKKAAKIAKQ
jgi:hypothetical protein